MDRNVILIDSQYLTKVSISAVIERMDGFTLATTFDRPSDALLLLNDISADIIITEYSDDFASEINNILKISKSFKTPVLVVTNSTNYEVIQGLIKSEVKGIITKNCSQEEIELAIVNVAAQRRFYCNNILDIVMNENPSAEKKRIISNYDLSTGELEVLELIANGLTTKHIAD